jgi:hypothetical protein
MALYVAESYDYEVHHRGQVSAGALGVGGGSEKIYLHVLEVTDDEVKQLAGRVDEDGNRQSDRLALPRNEEWWIAVSGKKAWPKIPLPKIVSRCRLEVNIPIPVPLPEQEAEALRKLGVRLPKVS